MPTHNQRMIELLESYPSTKEWCDIVGVLQTNLNGYKAEKRKFTISQVIAASNFHNTTTDYILGLTDNKSKPGKRLSALEMIEQGLSMLKKQKK